MLCLGKEANKLKPLGIDSSVLVISNYNKATDLYKEDKETQRERRSSQIDVLIFVKTVA